ncbi:MAG TPA: hypothetical protein VGJ09_05980 [Bryobacteraceae bacterium]
MVAPSFGLLLLAASGLHLSAAGVRDPQFLAPPSSPSVSGWVLADLNGDQQVDLATASWGRSDAGGYAQEVRVTLGAFRETSFHFRSRGAIVELSSRDVDGDHDGDLIVFEPLSNQPIGVWINDGAGSFHEGSLADFRALWGNQPGASWRVRFQPLTLSAISEDRTQTSVAFVILASPGDAFASSVRPDRLAIANPGRGHSRTRGPPRNS